MQDVQYGFFKVHKTLHDMFTNQVGNFKAQHQAGEDVAGQLHDMLEKWLIAHIKREDKLYATEVGANMQELVKDTQADGWLARSMKKFFG